MVYNHYMHQIDANNMMFEQMEKHGLVARGWRGGFHRAKNKSGSCHYTEMVISLGETFVESNTPERVLQTIMHEIAHALVGAHHKHDSVWAAKSRELGGTTYAQNACATVYKWLGRCPNCLAEIGCHRLTDKRKRGGCGKCHRSGKGFHRWVWRENVSGRVTA